MANLTYVTDHSFDAEVLKCDIPVLTHFSAEWSIPAKRVVPDLTKLATDYEDRMKVVELDIEANPAVTSDYQVLNIPTLILFKHGLELERITEEFSRATILKRVTPHLDQ
jgi:thioredoxin 1